MNEELTAEEIAALAAKEEAANQAAIQAKAQAAQTSSSTDVNGILDVIGDALEVGLDVLTSSASAVGEGVCSVGECVVEVIGEILS